MLSFNNLGMAYGGQTLFQGVNLLLTQCKRYGIVGPNGAGKSTLLRLIAVQEYPTDGEIQVPSDSSIGFLEQDHFKFENCKLVDVVVSGNARLWQAFESKEKLLSQSSYTEAEGLKLGELECVISEEDGYTAYETAKKLLHGLGIEKDFYEKPLSMLSGGFKLRVLMARTLFQNPQILLLDEPTNHLDMVAIDWLEKYLIQRYKGILLLISHDHLFLNRVPTHILDIDYGTITQYTGGFDQHLEEKALKKAQQQTELESKQKQIAHLQKYVDRFGAKASKAKQAQSRKKMIEKIEINEVDASQRRAPLFRFEALRPSGKKVIEVKKISKSYDKPVLENISFTLHRTEKVGLVGPNGIGKSTLLKIIVDQVKSDKGEYHWGHEIRLAYFAQDHHEQLHEKSTLFDWLQDRHPAVGHGEVRRTLGNMLFSKDDVFKNVLTLSGGEAARLLFADIMLSKPNVILLDEPTNHLDMEAIEALSEALKNYSGSVLFVSHDRNFVSSVAERLVTITPQGIEDYSVANAQNLEVIAKKYLERDLG